MSFNTMWLTTTHEQARGSTSPGSPYDWLGSDSSSPSAMPWLDRQAHLPADDRDRRCRAHAPATVARSRALQRRGFLRLTAVRRPARPLGRRLSCLVECPPKEVLAMNADAEQRRGPR
jgi:hypothetical protein